ncbi:MAG: CRISPR system precrRNA processing endoribonuclease RAMP protein Cas6 [Phototrophicaceae bacterium]
MIFDLQLHHIKFILEAQTLVHMGPQAGGQIRGALWQALNDTACIAPNERHRADHARHCPMCFMLELQANSPRGNNPPRPFAIRPPLGVRAEDDRMFKTGEHFEIGMTLMGKAVELFPYLVHGMRAVGQTGVGYGRGRFTIEAIEAHHPLRDEVQHLLNGQTVYLPTLMLSADDIQSYTQLLPSDTMRLRFVTPTTLKHQGKILAYPEFMPLIARILERCQAMAFHYGETSADPDIWQPQYIHLTTLAQQIKRTHDNTRQVDVKSGSRRSNRYHQIGGFVGEVQFTGDITPFMTWLLWGQSLQVGKNIVKGNGWYEIIG